MSLCSQLTRKKTYDDEPESKLARVLSLFDLTALGVGSTLGLGVYVLAGSVAYSTAGPAVTISFLIAAIASTLAGLCYCEFAARVPKAGSAYVYSYVTIGEFTAFTIGWNMLLEYAIGTSSVARGMTGYIDALIDNRIGKFLRELMPIDSQFLAQYPDFVSFLLIALITILLITGVKESSRVNNIFTTVNMVTILIMIGAGVWYSNLENWSISKESIPEDAKSRAGEGGFIPFGVAGIFAGAAKCFYGFVGFDCVATTGEEAKKPERNIPLSIILSLIIIFLSYFCVSTVLTLMWPYYLQDPDAPFIHIFQELGLDTIKWIVTVGALFALANSLFGSLFPIPRVIYSMAVDGLLFKFFAKVNPKTQTPIYATAFCGLLAGIMALIFDLEQLIDMMSIGTLLAYTIVAVSVLILRYKDDTGTPPQIESNEYTSGLIGRQLINMNFIKTPNSLTSTISNVGTLIFCVLSIVFCAVLNQVNDYDSLSIIVLTVLVAGMLLSMLIIGRQPVSSIENRFNVPLVPFIPCASILINLLLMFQLDPHTWIRLGVWVIIGYVIYFLYGIRHSTEGQKILKSGATSKGMVTIKDATV